MATEYATTLTVVDAAYGAPAALTDVSEVVRTWACVPLDEGTDFEGEFERSRVSARLLDPGDPDKYAWSLTTAVTNEDRSREEVDWSATVIVLEAAQTKVSIRVDRTTREERLRPLATRVRPPRLVRMLLDDERFDVRDGWSGLSASPSVLAPHGVESFVQTLLLDPDRRLPVVGMSQRLHDDQPTAGPQADAIATGVCGLAHVWVIPPDVTWNLSDTLTRRLSVYNGAVRLWWPALRTNDDPFTHPLWFPQLGARKIEDAVTNLVLETARTRYSEPMEFVELEERLRRERDEQLQAELNELMEVATRPRGDGGLSVDERARLEESVRARVHAIEDDRDQALSELIAAQEERERLTRENATLQSENFRLRARAGYWEGDADGHPVELTPEEEFVQDVRAEYQQRFMDADQEQWPLRPMRIGRERRSLSQPHARPLKRLVAGIL